MAELNNSKSHKLEPIFNTKNTKNFLKLNKLNLQKHSMENAIRKNNLSPRNTPKSARQSKSFRTGVSSDLDNVKKPPISAGPRFLGGDEKKKSNPLPKAAKEDITKLAKRNIKKKTQIQTATIEKRNQSVQSYNTADESFLKNAKILEPSAHILDKLKNKKTEAKIPKYSAQKKRVFGNYEAKEEIHLDNLKEFLETGAISRRRRTIEQRREDLRSKLGRYGKMTGSYSNPSAVLKSRPLTKYDIKSSQSTKVNARENYQNRVHLTKEVGDTRHRTRHEDPRKLVLVYKRK